MKKHRILHSLTGLAAVFCLTATASADTYSNDFDAYANGTTDLGDGTVIAGAAASIQGGRLQLTIDDQGLGFSSFSIPALPNSSFGFTATFDIEMFDAAGDNPPADGWSLNYGNAVLGELGAAEEGMTVAQAPDNLAFEVDTWMNFDAEQGVNISGNLAGADVGQLAFTNGPILGDGEMVSGTVTISWDPVSGASFATTGLNTNAAFANIPTGTFAGDDAFNFIISARVGGANEDLFIDNLVIETGEPADTDGDGLPDIYENANMLDPDDNGLNPNNNGVAGDPDQGADGDPDGDNLTNTEERDLGTDPQDSDTDMDGLADNVETNTGTWAGTGDTGTDPLNDDSDGDTLLDGVENPDLPFVDANQPGTDPHDADTDDDLISDGAEVAQGRNPTVFNAPPSGYVQNFNGFADGVTDLGDGTIISGNPASAQIVGEQLQLTADGLGNGFSSFSIPAIVGSSGGWTATFDLTLTDGPGANEPADGFSLNYGNAALGELGSAEEGMGAIASVTENLSFEVDTWMNLDAEQGVNIAEKAGGADINLAFTNGSILADGTSVSGPVTMSWDPIDGASFTTEGLLTNADFSNVPTTFVADDTHTFIISARVGGANQTLLIDNLVISVGSPQDNFRITEIVWIPSTGKGVPPRVDLTWNSRANRQYFVYANDGDPGDPGAWVELEDGVPSGGETTTWTDLTLPAMNFSTRRLYRIVESSN